MLTYTLIMIGATHEDEEKINESKQSNNSLSILACVQCVHIHLLVETGISKNPNVFGDLVLTPDQIKSLEGGEGRAQGFRYTARRWTYGVIPYEFDRNLSELCMVKQTHQPIISHIIHALCTYLSENQ